MEFKEYISNLSDDDIVSTSRLENEQQTHFKARRRILNYALDVYLKKRLGGVRASYLDCVRLIAKM